jgi:uncharacterized protein (TIGR02453 family)
VAYFKADAFKFLRDLAENNRREWFAEHRARYEKVLRDPFLALIADLAPDIEKISTHFRADAKPIGGSLFRIYRDARFSSDKSPYKTWAGARFFHERHKQLHAPSFYLHIAPGDCFVGGGLWHPDASTQRKIRDFLVENPSSWISATQNKAFLSKLQMGGDTLTRAPRSYDPNHPLINDIKRKDFVSIAALTDQTICSDALKKTVVEHFQSTAKMIDYLCAALDLEF